MFIDKKVIRVKFRLLGLLSKEHNIVVYIRRSPNKIVKFI